MDVEKGKQNHEATVDYQASMQELADLFSISAEQRASKQNFFKLPEILKPTIDDQEDEEKKRTRTISFNEDILKEIED